MVISYDGKDDDEFCAYNGQRPTTVLSRYYDNNEQELQRATKNDYVITYWTQAGRILLYKGKVASFSRYNPPWAEVEYTVDGSSSLYYLGEKDHDITWRHTQCDDIDIRDVGPAPKQQSASSSSGSGVVAEKPRKSRNAKKVANTDVHLRTRPLSAFDI